MPKVKGKTKKKRDTRNKSKKRTNKKATTQPNTKRKRSERILRKRTRSEIGNNNNPPPPPYEPPNRRLFRTIHPLPADHVELSKRFIVHPLIEEEKYYFNECTANTELNYFVVTKGILNSSEAGLVAPGNIISIYWFLNEGILRCQGAKVGASGTYTYKNFDHDVGNLKRHMSMHVDIVRVIICIRRKYMI